MTILRSFAYQDVGDLLLVVHRISGEIDDADWQMLVTATKKMCARTDKCLVLPGRARLNRAQMAQIGEVVSAGRMRVAVLVEGASARAITIALGWLTKRYRAFEPHQVTEALSYLSISRDRYESVFRVLDDLRREMSRPDAQHDHV
jgi:hypothetical protein